MAVGVPVLLPDVNLHIAADPAHTLHLQDGIAEVGPGGEAGTSWVEHANPRPAVGAEPLLARRPPLPQPGQQTLRDAGAFTDHRRWRICTWSILQRVPLPLVCGTDL